MTEIARPETKVYKMYIPECLLPPPTCFLGVGNRVKMYREYLESVIKPTEDKKVFSMRFHIVRALCLIALVEEKYNDVKYRLPLRVSPRLYSAFHVRDVVLDIVKKNSNYLTGVAAYYNASLDELVKDERLWQERTIYVEKGE